MLVRADQADVAKARYLPYPADLMEMWPVSPLVNSPRTDSLELIAPLS
jgi:putative SOS response-associated peptidase YedK